MSRWRLTPEQLRAEVDRIRASRQQAAQAARQAVLTAELVGLERRRALLLGLLQEKQDSRNDTTSGCTDRDRIWGPGALVGAGPARLLDCRAVSAPPRGAGLPQ